MVPGESNPHTETWGTRRSQLYKGQAGENVGRRTSKDKGLWGGKMHCIFMDSKEDSTAVKWLSNVETRQVTNRQGWGHIMKFWATGSHWCGLRDTFAPYMNLSHSRSYCLHPWDANPGLGEEGRGRRGMGRLLLQRSVSEVERALCFIGLVFPLISQYLPFCMSPGNRCAAAWWQPSPVSMATWGWDHFSFIKRMGWLP